VSERAWTVVALLSLVAAGVLGVAMLLAWFTG
jgi:hypothetical protein